jgi:hypothetical protein
MDLRTKLLKERKGKNRKIHKLKKKRNNSSNNQKEISHRFQILNKRNKKWNKLMYRKKKVRYKRHNQSLRKVIKRLMVKINEINVY